MDQGWMQVCALRVWGRLETSATRTASCRAYRSYGSCIVQQESGQHLESNSGSTCIGFNTVRELTFSLHSCF